MPKTILGKTELSVSQLGFGAAPVGFLDTQQAQITEILTYLLDHGVNLIDTAAAYKGSEQSIGNAISDRRDDYVLVSKCGMGGVELPELDNNTWHPKAITATIDRSLERLKTDHIDVMLLHSCKQSILEQGDALGAVMDAVKAGKVRFAGYSGDNEAAAYAATLPDISVIETSINICDQHNIDAVLPACIKHDIGVIAKRPIANAAWNPLDKQRGMYRSYAKTYHDRLNQMGVTPNQLGYSGHVELEWPEIALKFTLAIPGVHTAIVGTTDPHNAENNIESVQKNPLRQQVVDRLRDAFKQAQSAAGEPWLGQT
ncbi:MAG: aldo/keto reductase [Planctomycetota bacterium]